ncbi:rhodanese-like domain-containing protein [bacterium]|nr:MAG: rhodanese-like domain-containing protein [bacterium]
MSYQMEWMVSLECIEKDELLQKIKGNAPFVLVDTIGKYEGNKFKIKGAKTIPYPEVIDRRNELTDLGEIVIYCTRKTCPASKKVAAALKILKVPNVKVYEGGIEEWLANSLPVEEE